MKYSAKLRNNILWSQNKYQCHYTTLIYEAPFEQLWDGARAGAVGESKLRTNVGIFILKSQNYLKQQPLCQSLNISLKVNWSFSSVFILNNGILILTTI